MGNKNLEIGKRIKQRREELGMTQDELGQRLWLNKSTIQRYETGKIQNIKLPVLHAMAKQLDVDPNWLALKTDNMDSFEEEFESHSADNHSEIIENLIPSITILARHIDDIPEDERIQLSKNIESTIDLYLKSKGIKTSDD